MDFVCKLYGNTYAVHVTVALVGVATLNLALPAPLEKLCGVVVVVVSLLLISLGLGAVGAFYGIRRTITGSEGNCRFNDDFSLT